MPDRRPAPEPPRAAQVSEFYRERADRIRAAVGASVRTHDRSVIDDACQYAWLQLLRRDDVPLDEGGVAWLATVAIREGWRLARLSRAIPFGDLRGRGDIEQHLPSEPVTEVGDPEARALARAAHRDRVARFDRLSPLERRDLLLFAAGFSYDEIAQLTGSTWASVNRRLASGRTKLRRFTPRA
jgi:DNA-directed RNA polymerase specialized sigma24 family protein